MPFILFYKTPFFVSFLINQSFKHTFLVRYNVSSNHQLTDNLFASLKTLNKSLLFK